ncbi:hypothetical protein GCM10010372_27610 [Streptomyces tauricus]|nr:hypothetical protein GCM10010372_27610 [Streptomyces tauricus]
MPTAASAAVTVTAAARARRGAARPGGGGSPDLCAMKAAPSPGQLIGRQAEMTRMDELTGAAREGLGGAPVLRGEDTGPRSR